MLKKLTQNLALLSISFVVASFVGEVIIRYAAPQKLVKPCYQNDSDVAIKGVPDCEYHDDWNPEFFEYHVSLNNEGFRMQEDVEANKELVVCLGDSFTFGLGVDHEYSFWSMLQGDFKSDSTQLVNASFPAYSTGHCTLTLDRLSKRYNVKKAIYFMYFNDVFDNVNQSSNYKTHLIQIDKEEILLKQEKLYSPIKRLWHALKVPDWLYKNSHLVILIKHGINGDKKTISQRESFVKNDLSDKDIELMFKVSLAHIDKLSHLCKSKGIELEIVWIPCWLELKVQQDYNWTNNFPYRQFKAQLDSFPFLDPTPQLNSGLDSTALKISELYFMEGHFNQKGHKYYYEALKTVI